MNQAAVIYSSAINLIAQARRAEARLPAEERELRKQAYESARQERFRRAQIIENVCPTCEGKLIRGKKDKRNGYKRAWKCKACSEIHSI